MLFNVAELKTMNQIMIILLILFCFGPKYTRNPVQGKLIIFNATRILNVIKWHELFIIDYLTV